MKDKEDGRRARKYDRIKMTIYERERKRERERETEREKERERKRDQDPLAKENKPESGEGEEKTPKGLNGSFTKSFA